VADKVLMRGNNAMAEAAVRAGCRYYFGYPITPQNDVPEYLSGRMVEVGGTFIQAESEIASIYMVLGASAAGGRVMTSSSSPGISLKQEGMSFLAGHELPAVIANVVRGGPGLGNIAGSQSDYFQMTRGGGHGDYRMIVLAPGNVQEMADLTYLAFDLADKYRTQSIILADGMMGNTMEPVILPEMRELDSLPEKDYVVDGMRGKRPSRARLSLILEPKELEDHNWKLQRKYKLIQENEVRFEEYELEDAEMVIVAFGTAARIAKGAIRRARSEGLKVGMIRPITLWPFPSDVVRQLADRVKEFLVFELNAGQMIEDVKLSLEGTANVSFYGRPGGSIPTPRDLAKVIINRYSQKFRLI